MSLDQHYLSGCLFSLPGEIQSLETTSFSSSLMNTSAQPRMQIKKSQTL